MSPARKSEEQEEIYRVDTVPPPDGEEDPYGAVTKVGPMSKAFVDEMMGYAGGEGAAGKATVPPQSGVRESTQIMPRAPIGGSPAHVTPPPAAVTPAVVVHAPTLESQPPAGARPSAPPARPSRVYDALVVALVIFAVAFALTTFFTR